MASFSDSVNNNIDSIKLEISTKCTKIAVDLFTNIIQITPSPAFPGKYAKGLLANQWYPQLGGSFSSSVSGATSSNGADSLSRVATLSTAKEFFGKDGAMTLANNLDYSGQAEALGWTRTGPYRMVFKSIQKAQAQLL